MSAYRAQFSSNPSSRSCSRVTMDAVRTMSARLIGQHVPHRDEENAALPPEEEARGGRERA